MKIKFINSKDIRISVFISANPVSIRVRPFLSKNDAITLSFLMLLSGWSTFGNAQTPTIPSELPAITEPGRRTPREVERQVERINKRQVEDESKDNRQVKEVHEKPPPGAKTKHIDGVFKGLKFEGGTVYLYKEFTQYYKDFVDKSVTLADIFLMARAVQNKYRDDGYLLTRVIVPEQDPPKDGKILLQIVEGYIDSIRVEGDADEYKERIETYLDKITGIIPINNREIERYLLLINDLPGISAKAVVRPAKEGLGATELVVRVEVKRFDGFAMINNRGSKFRGPFRAMLIGTSNSMLSLEEQLKLVLLTAFDDEEQRYASISYKQPLGTDGFTFNLSASYGPSKPGNTLERFEIDSQSYYFSGAVNYPLIRARRSNLNIKFGFEVINTDVDILGAKSIRDRLRVFHAAANYDILDLWEGQSQLGISVRQGLQALGASSKKGDKLSRFEGNSSFTSVQANLSRLQPLSQLQPILSDTALLVATKGQYAFDTLLSEEEFYLGGEQSGRGYDTSEITGEHGLAVTAEIQQNLTTPFTFMPRYQLYGFYDFGLVWNNDIGTDHRQSLASAGAGFRLMLFDHFSVGFEVAKPLTRIVSSENNKDPRLYFHVSGHY